MTETRERYGHGTRALARILIVEDEKIVARDLENILEDLGYEVAANVATGDEAIAAAREQRTDLVLMDVRLRDSMDGVEAAASIRRERAIPVIYLTAHSDDETLRRAMMTEPFGYLVKPFKAHELRCAIEIALHKHEIDARLRERELWLSTTLRSIGDGVVAVDAEQNVTLLNPVAEALTGWKHEDALGRALDDILRLVSRGDREPVENPLGRALRDRDVTTLRDDVMLLAKEGATIPIDDNAAPIIADNGRVLGGVMVFRDATDRRRAEESVRELNAELEHRVFERTKQLEAANKELEAFSYSIAHDLRAPLRGIDGFSQALIEDHAANLGPEALDHLARVRAGAQRMGQLIDDLLRLSRVARNELHRRTVDLSRLALEVRSELEASGGDRTVVLVVQDDVFVVGDELLLRIVVENLLRNAWKFTSKVTAARIELGTVEQNGETVVFVRDNGAGFDPKYSHKLFGAFQRLHAVGDFEGTGIGLAIVQRIVHRHGGRIWAEGSVGHGATFSFALPL